jgi:hypothetical protein
MTFYHKILLLPLLMITACSISAVGAITNHYFPKVSGKPSGIAEGILLNYGRGMGEGSLTVKDDRGREITMYVSGVPFTVNGRATYCGVPPRPPRYHRDPLLCRFWPAAVVIGRTRVRVPYWRGSRDGNATLIARGLTTVVVR